MKQSNRVEHTKRALKTALLMLMRQKPLDKISVKEICEAADVNRSTFYVYFGSPRELLDAIQDDMYVEILGTKHQFTSTEEMLEQICEIVDKYRDLILLALPTREDMGMFKIFGIYRDDLVKNIMREAGVDRERAERAHLFVSVGSGALMTTWLIQHPDKSCKGVLDELLLLVSRGLSGYFG